MTMEVHVKSRLNFCVARILDGIEQWDLLILPPVPIQQDDQYYKIVDGDKLPVLANRFYGSPVLWWVIALANDIQLSIVDIYPGLVVRIPSARFVEQLLFRDVLQRRRQL